MLGIGSMELLMILVLALLVVGPKKLPQMARTLGKVFGEFRRVSTDMKHTLDRELQEIERQEAVKKATEELRPEELRPEELRPEAAPHTPHNPETNTTNNTKSQHSGTEQHPAAPVPDEYKSHQQETKQAGQTEPKQPASADTPESVPPQHK